MNKDISQVIMSNTRMPQVYPRANSNNKVLDIKHDKTAKIEQPRNLDFSKIHELYETGGVEVTESFNIDRSTFTFFKLPDGKIYSRVRDLDTGDVKYFPTIDAHSFTKPSEVAKGEIFEGKV